MSQAPETPIDLDALYAGMDESEEDAIGRALGAGESDEDADPNEDQPAKEPSDG